MPAFDKEVCITKLISHVPENPGQGLPAIVGQVVVFDTETGLCRLVLDGPTVTARRTAAVTGLFLRQTNRVAFDHCLIMGAGVQGRSHLEMLREIAPPRKVTIVSRRPESSQALALHAESLGFTAQALPEVPNMESFDLIITCTPAQEAVMRSRPQSNAIVCAIGSYTPKMLEWHPDIIRWIASTGQVFVDSRDADHEAGDLIQATLDPANYPCLEDLVKKNTAINLDPAQGPILFKSCGWGGWDLAAARCALRLWSPKHDG
jgi:ornithine cyclodeaminase